MLQNQRRIVELITDKKFADADSPNALLDNGNNPEFDSDDYYQQNNYREFDTWEKSLQQYT